MFTLSDTGMRRNLIVNVILTLILIACIFEGKDNLEDLGIFVCEADLYILMLYVS